MKGKLLQSIKNYFEALDTSVISTDRREVLQVLIDFAKSKLEKEETIILNYVCTHNSRRSQISQIMGQVASY